MNFTRAVSVVETLVFLRRYRHIVMMLVFGLYRMVQSVIQRLTAAVLVWVFVLIILMMKSVVKFVGCIRIRLLVLLLVIGRIRLFIVHKLV